MLLKNSLLSILLLSSLALSSCADTTGLSPDSSRKPKGNLIASVSVVEYADLQCEACRAVQAAVIKPLLEKYGDRIRFEFRHFPFSPLILTLSMLPRPRNVPRIRGASGNSSTSPIPDKML